MACKKNFKFKMFLLTKSTVCCGLIATKEQGVEILDKKFK